MDLGAIAFAIVSPTREVIFLRNNDGQALGLAPNLPPYNVKPSDDSIFMRKIQGESETIAVRLDKLRRTERDFSFS
jgi:hypothetical protein